MRFWSFYYLYKCLLLGTTVGIWKKVVEAKYFPHKHVHKLQNNPLMLHTERGEKQFGQGLVSKREGLVIFLNKMT